MTDKKLSAPQFERWLNSSATKAYLQVVKEHNNAIAEFMASGQCVATPNTTASTAELYHQAIGRSVGARECYDAKELMLTYDLLEVEDEPEK